MSLAHITNADSMCCAYHTGAIAANDVIVSTTGFTSRELYELREKLGQVDRNKRRRVVRQVVLESGFLIV